MLASKGSPFTQEVSDIQVDLLVEKLFQWFRHVKNMEESPASLDKQLEARNDKQQQAPSI